jgi:hypothetical protein
LANTETSWLPVILELRFASKPSKFCFLKLPIVLGYTVPFTAISKKQNRKGSPRSLIYLYIGKLTFFVIKQFFAFGREHQTLMRSRLRRFLMLGASHLDYRNFDSPFGLPQDDLLKQKGCYSLCKNAVLIPLFTKKDTAFQPCLKRG